MVGVAVMSGSAGANSTSSCSFKAGGAHDLTSFFWLWVSHSHTHTWIGVDGSHLWHTHTRKEKRWQFLLIWIYIIDRWEFHPDPGVEGEPGNFFFFLVIFFRFSWFNMNSSHLSVDRPRSHAGENPRPVKPKICLVHRDEIFTRRGRSCDSKTPFWTRIFIGIFWESCRTSLQRKLSLGQKRERELERLVFCSFIPHVLFLFLQERCQSEQTVNAQQKRWQTSCLYAQKWTQVQVICKEKQEEAHYIYPPAHIIASGSFL